MKGVAFPIGTFSTYIPIATYHFGYKDVSSKSQAKERLEVFVQEYIDWAKTEGRF